MTEVNVATITRIRPRTQAALGGQSWVGIDNVLTDGSVGHRAASRDEGASIDAPPRRSIQRRDLLRDRVVSAIGGGRPTGSRRGHERRRISWSPDCESAYGTALYVLRRTPTDPFLRLGIGRYPVQNRASPPSAQISGWDDCG
jgi:hypothetical protein